MKILAIESSATCASVCLAADRNLIAEYSINYKLTHSQTLMPMIEEITNLTELDINTLDFIACVSGPGSFTGLRIGAATAKGLAHGLNIPIIPVPTLDSLAYNIFNTDKMVCPIMDARRNQVYSAFYIWENGVQKRLTDYMAESIEKIIQMAQAYKKEVIFVGDGINANRSALENYKEFIFPPLNCNIQKASSAAGLAFDFAESGNFVPFSEFSPIYLRKPQAERELLEKNSSLGV